MPKDMIEPGDEPRPARDVWQAMARGFAQRCPKCGKGALFHSYLKVNDTCGVCGEELHHQRADDAPPYFTIMIVGHIVVGGLLAMEKALVPPLWVHMIVWLPLTVLARCGCCRASRVRWSACSGRSTCTASRTPGGRATPASRSPGRAEILTPVIPDADAAASRAGICRKMRRAAGRRMVPRSRVTAHQPPG